jgi:hypothetical protein
MFEGTLHTVSRVILGSILAFACLAKATNLSWFVEAVKDYKLLPAKMSPLVAVAVVMCEGVAAVGVLARGTSFFYWIALVLFGCFSLVIGINLARGRFDAQCACFGPKSARLSWRLLARNVCLAGLSWVSVRTPDTLTTGFTSILLVLLVIAFIPQSIKLQLRSSVEEA